jgi:hypothetical protein
MTAHHVLKTADGKKISLITPHHAEVNVWFHPSNSSDGAVVNSMALCPFNKGDDSEAKKNQVMTQDESELFAITPFKMKLLGAALSF